MTKRFRDFYLPRITWTKDGARALSFLTFSLEQLGFYNLEKSEAVIIDPVVTGAAHARAVMLHETTHQLLGINTTVGVFTTILANMAKENIAKECFQRCVIDQWSVQEAAATYAGMALTMEKAPEIFDAELRGLPTADLDQPPYREVFNAVEKVFPLRLDMSAAQIDSQYRIVLTAAFTAMNNDCLLRLAKFDRMALTSAEMANDVFQSCLEQSVHARFEQILSYLPAEELVMEVCERKETLDVSQSITWLLSRVASCVEGVVEVQPDDAIQDHAKKCHGWITVPKKPSEPLPAIRFKRTGVWETPNAAMENRLDVELLMRRLEETARRGLGMVLTIAIPKVTADIAHVVVQSYYLEEADKPAPKEFGDDETFEPLPDDFKGLTRTDILVQLLGSFPGLPQIAVFLMDSRDRWIQVPGAEELTRSAVHVCRQLDLSEETVRDGLLRFGSLSRGANYFVLKQPAVADNYAGCIFTKSSATEIGIQRIRSEAGISLFATICERLDIPELKGVARELLPHFDIFSMIAFD